MAKKEQRNGKRDFKTFWIEPSDRFVVSLRRLDLRKEVKQCPKSPWKDGGCVAEVEIDRIQIPGKKMGWSGYIDSEDNPYGKVQVDDVRWPLICRNCGEMIEEGVERRIEVHVLYRRADTGEEMLLQQAAVGAMYDASWLAYHPPFVGSDGMALIVVCPGKGNDRHTWHVDGEASNCDRKKDHTHKCWVRHGDPRTGNITVDKNGETCKAGAGSIVVDGWHGFLREGWLREC